MFIDFLFQFSLWDSWAWSSTGTHWPQAFSFNSLYEIHAENGWYGTLPSELSTFNSLYEIRKPAPAAEAKAIMAPFNSLYEILCGKGAPDLPDIDYLSILFMRFQWKCFNCQLAVFLTFNSLYEIPELYQRRCWCRLILSFQFSLWDSAYVSYSYDASDWSFNSLYEIHTCISTHLMHMLSSFNSLYEILRYNNTNHAHAVIISFNSLYEILTLLFVDFLSPLRSSLSILFMRFLQIERELDDLRKNIDFQFSLWDSASYQRYPAWLNLNGFQFSLWDSHREISTKKKSSFLAFNSLYEIHRHRRRGRSSWRSRRQRLSILFMRFWKRGARWGNPENTDLSILFMRFYMDDPNLFERLLELSILFMRF